MIEVLFYLSVLALLQAYVIYPLLGLVVGTNRESVASPVRLPISVLVPAHNEEDVIAAKIENFLSIDYPPDLLELVIADDGSRDGTAKVVGRYTDDRIRLLRSHKRQGKAAAMNRLAAAARYPHLLFTDANVVFAAETVQRLSRWLEQQDVGAVTGEVQLVGSSQEFSAGEKLYYRMEHRIQRAESRIGSVMGVDGGMYLLRRELYKEIPTDTVLDDFLISLNVMRAGKRVVYDGSATAKETGTLSMEEESRRRTRIAAGAMQLLKRGRAPRLTQPILWLQFLSHKLLRWFSPVIFIMLFVTNLFLVTLGTIYFVTLLAQVFVFLLILLVWGVPAFRRTTLGAVVYYFALSQFAMLCGLIRGLLNRQSSQWEKTRRSAERLGRV